MRVIKVHIDDFKNLQNFDADLKGQNIILLGDNEVGKTSFLQFIEIALGNQKVIPPNISGGGHIVVDIEGKPVKFELDLVRGKPIIKVTGQGISIDNKKGAIASLVGAVEFDVTDFVNGSKTSEGRKKQVADYVKRFPQEAQDILAKCYTNVQRLFDERKETNKDVKNLEGAVKLNPLYNHSHELHKFVPVDVAETLESLKAAQKINTQVNNVKSEIVKNDKTISDNNTEVEELKRKIEALNITTDILIKKNTDYSEWLKSNTIIDVKQFEDVISKATETNHKADNAKKLKDDFEKLEILKNSAGEQTALIEMERQMILDTIRDLPEVIEGLSFDEDQLIYNGVVVDGNSLSTSTVGELGVKLKRAENPNIPILLRCGESWGKARIKWLQGLSKAENFQVIMEKVDISKDELTIEIMKDEAQV